MNNPKYYTNKNIKKYEDGSLPKCDDVLLDE
jgi:hypothetical protein